MAVSGAVIVTCRPSFIKVKERDAGGGRAIDTSHRTCNSGYTVGPLQLREDFMFMWFHCIYIRTSCAS